MTTPVPSTVGLPSRYLVLAAVLFASELILGIGLIGVGGGFIVATIMLLTQHGLRARLRRSAVFLALALASFGWLILNAQVAKKHAVPVILACKQFRAEHNHYPSDLQELIPAQLPSLPAARYTLVGRKFVYDKDRAALCFAAMFHGVFCYDLHSDKWITNE